MRPGVGPFFVDTMCAGRVGDWDRESKRKFIDCVAALFKMFFRISAFLMLRARLDCLAEVSTCVTTEFGAPKLSAASVVSAGAEVRGV